MLNKIILTILFLLQISVCHAGAPPVIFFSDLTDGPTDGWEGSGTKGAAVSVWGLNLGSAVHTSYLTVGGQTLYADESGIAEWGATTSPTVARGMQRITFYLNSSMTTGSGTIAVTTADGTSGTIPFYFRSSGNIYFVAADGSDSNAGTTTAAPWKTGMKARGTVAAGDVVYFRGGNYIGLDYRDTTSVTPTNYCYIHFYSGNHATGTANNSITFAAYPAEEPLFGDGTSSMPFWIRQVGYSPNFDQLDYWTFSKFRVQIYSATLQQNNASYSSSNYLRFVGMDARTTAAATGTGVCFWLTGNQGQSDVKFYGNYVHHTGKALDWEEADGSGYRVGPIYFQGFGDHGSVDVGWNEFAYNNGQSQFYGHYCTDSIALLHYHDNYIHHTSTPPWVYDGVPAQSAVFGGGDDSSCGGTNYEYLMEAYVYNNIWFSNGGGIRLGDTTSRGSYGGDLYFYGNSHYGNTTSSSRELDFGNQDILVLKNNIVYTTAGSGHYYYDTGLAVPTGSNNIWYGLGVGIPSWDDAGTSVEADPIYILPAAGNLNVNEDTSPAVDAGWDAGAVYDSDYNGFPRSATFDIGALESGAPPDDTPPTVFISTDAQTVHCGGIEIAWTDGDNISVTGRKYRVGSAPDDTHGTAATSPQAVAENELSIGENVIYIGATDGINWGIDSVAITYTGICREETPVGRYGLTGANGVYSTTGAAIISQ